MRAGRGRGAGGVPSAPASGTWRSRGAVALGKQGRPQSWARLARPLAQARGVCGARDLHWCCSRSSSRPWVEMKSLSGSDGVLFCA